jgi:hypothetical protein
MGVGRWALGVGRWALGVGRWALGVGRWVGGRDYNFSIRKKIKKFFLFLVYL